MGAAGSGKGLKKNGWRTRQPLRGASKKKAPAENAGPLRGFDGCYLVPITASLQAFATLNFTTFFAGIFMAAPVWGFLPVLAFLFTSTSLPMPGIVKEFLASLYESCARVFIISAAIFLVTPVFFAIESVT